MYWRVRAKILIPTGKMTGYHDRFQTCASVVRPERRPLDRSLRCNRNHYCNSLHFRLENKRQGIKASGRNRITRDIASPRESDLRQVGLRRQICPQICFLWRGSVARVRATLRVADSKSFPAARLKTAVQRRGFVAFKPRVAVIGTTDGPCSPQTGCRFNTNQKRQF